MLKAYEERAKCFVDKYSQYGSGSNKVQLLTNMDVHLKVSWLFIFNVDPAFGLCVEVGCVANVSDQHTASIGPDDVGSMFL
jgi:hypothetical protein